MLTRTSHYALRALIFLTQHEDRWPISGLHIAREVDIPPKYLSKVLGDLVRNGVLESSPGRTGGFRLKLSAECTMLIDVLAPFEHFDLRACPFGNHHCNDERPCGAHRTWKQVLAAQQNFLRGTSLRDVAFPAKSIAAERHEASTSH